MATFPAMPLVQTNYLLESVKNTLYILPYLKTIVFTEKMEVRTMKQKKLLPGQFIFGIFTCLLIPAEILAFHLDVPIAFLYAPFFIIPLYLLLSALAHFPVTKAIGLWACVLLPPAVICSLAAGIPAISMPLGWILAVLTVLAAIAAVLLGIVAVSSSNIWLGWGAAALAFAFMGGAMGFFLAGESIDIFWDFGLGAAPFLIICPFIIVDLNCAIRATRKNTSK